MPGQSPKHRKRRMHAYPSETEVASALRRAAERCAALRGLGPDVVMRLSLAALVLLPTLVPAWTVLPSWTLTARHRRAICAHSLHEPRWGRRRCHSSNQPRCNRARATRRAPCTGDSQRARSTPAAMGRTNALDRDTIGSSKSAASPSSRSCSNTCNGRSDRRRSATRYPLRLTAIGGVVLLMRSG